MKNVYSVYGRTFTNKKDAMKYHKKIYGNSNYQASTVAVYQNDKLIAIKNLAGAIIRTYK